MDDVTIYAAAKFLSTPSARRATRRLRQGDHSQMISIHALREEGDHPDHFLWCAEFHFYPRPPRGGRPSCVKCDKIYNANFYPRPPRGGRLFPSAHSRIS